MRVIAKALLPLILIAAIPALAQTVPPTLVGRVSLVSGTLAYFGPEDADWSAAKVNLPASEGAWFATDPQSRAELRIGAESVALAPDTQLNIAELREQATQLALTQGRLDLHLRSLKQDETAEIDVPQGGVWLTQPGVYDVDSGGPDQPTRITVFEGSAHFVGGGVDTMVNAGDALVLSGTDTLSAAVERAAPDEFVRWCRSNDWQEHRLAAPYHVSPAMTGYEELDAYGEWDAMPSYGEVWFPKAVPADWAPYREGRWVWIEPWGWNWVDDEPWGFAPFHYGRWARIEDRWAWVPGEFVPEPVYAPALVAFIPPPEIDTAVPVAADAGPPVGWFPLAPGEVYWPSYTRDPTYIRNVNITNVNIATIVNITKVVGADPPPQLTQQRFANRAAATVVPATVLAASAPVAKAAVAVAPQILQRASVSLRPPPVVSRPAAAASAAAAPPSAQPVQHMANTAANPVHPPGKPNFAQLAPAPRLGHPGAAPQPVSTPPAAQATQPVARAPGMTSAHPPGPPDFAHLPPARLGPHEPARSAQQPAQAAPGAAAQATPQPPPAATPGHPSGPSDFAHLPPTHRMPPQQAGQGAAPTGHGPTPTAAAPAAVAPEHAAQQRAASDAAARQQSAQQAQQRAASDAVARQQAQQRSAADAAGRQQAQQRAASDAVARQQAQQRAAADAARQQAAQQTQQRAAADAARRQAAQQAQQQAAQAQQRAAAQAAAQQQAAQAQQRAAAQAAAQQQAAQAQQRAAAQAAAQATARQKQAQACGHPGQPPCPH